MSYEDQAEKFARIVIRNLVKKSFSDYRPKRQNLQESKEKLLRMQIRKVINERESSDTLTLNNDSFKEVDSNQDFSNFADSDAGELVDVEDNQQVDPTEQFAVEIDATGAYKGRETYKGFGEQLKKKYKELSSLRDRAFFDNWFFINTLLQNRNDELNLIVPKGVLKRDADEFFKEIDLTGIAEDLEQKTANPGEEIGPSIDSVEFKRDDKGSVSAYDIIDQYISQDTPNAASSEDVGSQPTGINELGTFFNTIKKKISDAYKSLTSKEEQRKAFIITLLTLARNDFDAVDAEHKLETSIENKV